MGDFDGDSDPDLAVANLNSDNVSVLLGNGLGSFGAAANFAAGDGPASVAVGDFDGDSDPDLAVANAVSHNVSVLLNTTPSNQAPTAGADAYTHYGSDTALSVAAPGVLANDTDSDNDTLTAALVSGPSNGTLTLNADGSFSYQPNEDFVGQDSFTYKANDGSADSNTATVTLTVGAGCNARQATITGTAGANRLTGTAADDVIAGLGGDDTLLAAGGNDTICGGSGRDSINAASGNDHANGGSGNDSARGDAGNDTLLGGAGVDLLQGDAGNDTLSGGTGSPDSCKGDTGTDTLAPAHGCEQISGIP